MYYDWLNSQIYRRNDCTLHDRVTSSMIHAHGTRVKCNSMRILRGIGRVQLFINYANIEHYQFPRSILMILYLAHVLVLGA